jgi:hypothetical protein
VTQKLLDNPQVSPAIKEMGGEGMTQHVRMDFLAYSRFPSKFFYYSLHPSFGEALPVTIKEQGVATFLTD